MKMKRKYRRRLRDQRHGAVMDAIRGLGGQVVTIDSRIEVMLARRFDARLSGIEEQLRSLNLNAYRLAVKQDHPGMVFVGMDTPADRAAAEAFGRDAHANIETTIKAMASEDVEG